jgi:hydroxymethylpyrimidine/phosphomethylpyrimidine kinase
LPRHASTVVPARRGHREPDPRRDNRGVTDTAIPRVLSIAGSDSSGGAGIQADLKAFARCGVYGMTAITAVTAQSTVQVLDVHKVPASVVRAQIEAVLADIGADAIKIGMLGDAETVRTVASCLREWPAQIPIVLDPLLSASTGAELLAPDGVQALIDELLPLVTVLTPNLPEAHALAAVAGMTARADGEDGLVASDLLGLGPQSVVITGGHRAVVSDLYCDRSQTVEIGGQRHAAQATHGSGCTHSAVIAAALACGCAPLDAARFAAVVAADAVRDGLDELGRGSGPVDVLGPASHARSL